MSRISNAVAQLRPLRVIVVEDEEEFNQYLCDKLRQFPNVEVIGSATIADDAYQLIAQNRPDGVFLDIKLTGGDAFQIIDRLRKNRISPLPPIALITGFNEYAPQSINEYSDCVVKYLTKPFVKDYQTKLQTCLDAFDEARRTAVKFLLLKSKGGLYRVNLDELCYVEVAGSGKTIFVTDTATHEVDLTLTKSLQILPPYFAQVNRHNLVNVQKINFLMDDQVTLSVNGKEKILKISETYVNDVVALMNV